MSPHFLENRTEFASMRKRNQLMPPTEIISDNCENHMNTLTQCADKTYRIKVKASGI